MKITIEPMEGTENMVSVQMSRPGKNGQEIICGSFAGEQINDKIWDALKEIVMKSDLPGDEFYRRINPNRNLRNVVR